MGHQISRRRFLECGVAASALAVVPLRTWGHPSYAMAGDELDFPLVDFHAHIESDFPVERAAQVAKVRGVKFGVVEHGGFHQKLASDDDLKRYIERLSGQPFYKGMQAEGLDWMECFSKEAVAQLDFVLADALTFPEKDGRLVRLWTSEAKVVDKQDFMDRYVDFIVRVISQEPIDIFANPTFLPEPIVAEYAALWTKERMAKVIEAAVKHEVAIEINSRYNIPSLAFIRTAKDAGVKFSFGSNAHGEEAGRLDYCLKVAKEIGLRHQNMFVPAPADKKPILRRTLARLGVGESHPS
jgi:histidinol phosphatase-like PHP family hydrolase